MVEIHVDSELCTGCGECLEVCPKGPRIWALEKGSGKKVARAIDAGSCLYCTLCVTRCPVNAIKVVSRR